MNPADPSVPARAAQSRGGSRRRLRSIRNLRALVATVLRAVEAGGDVGDPARARVVFHGVTVLGALIRDDDVERRIAALEAANARDASGRSPGRA